MSYSIRDAFKELKMIDDDIQSTPIKRFTEAIDTKTKKSPKFKKETNIEQTKGTIANVLTKNMNKINAAGSDVRKMKEIVIELLQSDEIIGDNKKRAQKAIMQLSTMRFPSQILSFIGTLMSGIAVNKDKDLDEDIKEDYYDEDDEDTEVYDWYEDYENHPLVNAYEKAAENLGIEPEGSTQGRWGIVCFYDAQGDRIGEVNFEDEIDFMNSLGDRFVSQDLTEDECIKEIEEFIKDHFSKDSKKSKSKDEDKEEAVIIKNNILEKAPKKLAGEYVIPDNVTSISPYAFLDCRNLTSVVIPKSVKSIGNYVFSGCRNLTSIVIPKSVTSIGLGAFYDCRSLTIYCEISNKPSGWNKYWNKDEIGWIPVKWGYKINKNESLEEDKKVLKEGYVGQTVEDFLEYCAGPDAIDNIVIADNSADDYTEVFTGSYDELKDKSDLYNADFADFDCGSQPVTINVSKKDISGGSWYETIGDFIEDFNGDEIVVYSVDDEEEIFSGYKEDLPEEFEDYYFTSFDAPSFICINISEIANYDDDDYDDYEDDDLGESKKSSKKVNTIKESKKLKEEFFNANSEEDIEKAAEILDANKTEEPVEMIIDLEANSEEDIKDSYVGDIILKCNVCNTLIYKKPEEVIHDEENPELCNKDEECVHCNSKEGYEAVGQVAPIASEEPEEEVPVEEPVEENPEDVSNEENPEDEKTEKSSEEESEDLDDLDESLFNSLANKYLNSVYENIDSFTTTNVNYEEDSKNLVLEGIIKFKSGKTSTSSFKFESKGLTKRGKLQFIGSNESFSKSPKAFKLIAEVKDKKLCCESLTYNYGITYLNEAKNLYGRVINTNKTFRERN